MCAFAELLMLIIHVIFLTIYHLKIVDEMLACQIFLTCEALVKKQGSIVEVSTQYTLL